MKMSDFKELSIDEKITRLNKHLLMLKPLDGRLEDKFKMGEFEFSYSLLKKNAKDLGIMVDGARYIAYELGKTPIVNDEQKIVKPKKIVKQQQKIVNDSEIHLTKDEIMFVKELFKSKQNIVTASQTLFVPQMNGPKKTTGISVYIDVWERWGEFKNRYNMYSGTDLLALAIEEFMEKYDD